MRALGFWILAACAATLTACGDDGGDTLPDAAPGMDAGPAVDAGPGSTGFVVAGDYMGTGIASTIAVPALDVTRGVVAGVASGDPVVRHQDGRVFIVNRFGADNVTVLDDSDYSLIAQISTGAGSNPQDVAAMGSTLYVAALNAPGILVLDLDRPGDGVIETIALSDIDPADGIPDCNSVHLVGDTLYATCGLLESFAPVGPGKVVMIDTGDSTVSGSFDLQNPNPVGFLQAASAGSALGDDLLMPTVDFGDLTQGCIERIRTGDTPGSECLVQNSALGGYASDLAYAPDDTLYIAVTRGYDGPVPQASLTSYDVAGQTLRDAAISPAGQRIFDVALCPTGELLAADAEDGGIRVYAADGSELTTDALDVGQPPVPNGTVCL